MKQFGFTLMLFVIVLSPLAAVCQKMPDEPVPAVQSTASESTPQSNATPASHTAPPALTQQPAAPGQAPNAAKPAAPDADWRKIQRLVHGELIVVNSTYGPSLQCRFAGATDDVLLCDAPGSPEGTGYSFERAKVVSVEAKRPGRNWHPVWIASIIAGGLVTGLIATRTNDAGDAARIGGIGALVVAAVGAPIVLLQSQDRPMVSVVYRPHAFKFHGKP
jgi:hypothetical protein